MYLVKDVFEEKCLEFDRAMSVPESFALFSIFTHRETTLTLPF